MMSGFEISSVPVILPTLEASIGADAVAQQWIADGYTVAVASVLMATGSLADRFGRRRAFVVATVLFTAATLFCGLVTAPGPLIAARVLQGIGGGAMLTTLVAVLAHAFPAGRPRTVAFGFWGVVFGAGLGFGPILGGLISSAFGWQWVFLVNVPVGVVTVVLILAAVRESRDTGSARVDVPGVISLSVAVAACAFGVTEGVAGGLSASALAAFGLSAIAAAVFVAVERWSAHPMVDFGIFGHRDFSGALLGSAGMNFAFWPAIVYLPAYLQAGRGYSVAGAGLLLLGYTLPTLLLPPIAERLAVRYGARRTIPAGLATIAAGLFLVCAGGVVVDAPAVLLAGFAVAGIGLGLTNTPVTNTITGSVSADRAGMASGLDMSARMVSLAVNIAVMGVLFNAAPSPTDGLARFTLYGGVAAVFFAVASAVVFRRPTRAIAGAGQAADVRVPCASVADGAAAAPSDA
ncbi:Spectinomycin tetracycline efflux pump [Tsukamurella paurometabola]|uniref:Spectinomycin tetracycline efflux pump n=2 Tax=Tsukamurella paurometabola TaxID=2061 RepID=A0A3P8L4R8_TSUPA|nr:Spectinomycin tetracycline efflux pump [Tsukamurella paurometabola]